jgi:hypothetical protein
MADVLHWHANVSPLSTGICEGHYVSEIIAVEKYCRIGPTPSSNDSFKWPIVFTRMSWINRYLHFWLEYRMAFSNEKDQCWPIQKKYVKNIGHFSECLRPDSTVCGLVEKIWNSLIRNWNRGNLMHKYLMSPLYICVASVLVDCLSYLQCSWWALKCTVYNLVKLLGQTW